MREMSALVRWYQSPSSVKKNVGRGGGINKCQEFFPHFSQGTILKLKESCTFIFKILTRCSSKIMWISQLSCNIKAEFRKRLNSGVSKANADTPDGLNVCLIQVALGQNLYYPVALQHNIRISRILLAVKLLIDCPL